MENGYPFKFLGGSLQYSQGIEYHLSKECPPSGPCRHVPPKTFPVDIVNYPPLQVKIVQGVEKYRLFDPCTAPYCRYGTASHIHCEGPHCPDTDSSFNCVDQLNRRISCSTGLPLNIAAIVEAHPAFGSRESSIYSYRANFKPTIDYTLHLPSFCI
jgi:hypothetical protein